MSTHRAHRIALALAACMLPQVVAAQLVMPGARVRVMDSTTRTPLAEGELVRQSGDSVTIRTESNITANLIHTTWVIRGQSRLEVRTAVHDQALLGGVLGGVAGAAVGYALTSGAPSPSCDLSGLFKSHQTHGQAGETNAGMHTSLMSGGGCWFSIPPSTLGTVGGALAGILVGGLIGKAFRTETWQRAGHPPVRLGIVPGSSGMLLTASVSF